MKTRKLFIALTIIVASVVATSCEKTDDQSNDGIEGTYVGLFTNSTSLKSSVLETGGEDDGIAEVTMIGDDQVQVHCSGNNIDTTIMLNYFEHNDSVMVCLTGDDFQRTYGHMYGAGHMSGGMMGDMMNGETEWMHHMNDEHQNGDEHFGGFNMHDGTFTYSFRMMDGTTPYYLKFHGTKGE
jgi:hypothetical protein